MQYYRAKIRLSGSTMNEVEKILSAPEVLVMQFIHGMDAVIHVTPHEKKAINTREEKDRMKGLYDKALVKRDQSIDTIFGPLGSVPEKLPEDMLERFDIYDDDETDILDIAKTTTRRDKRSGNSGQRHQPKNLTEANNLDRIIPSDQVSLSQLAE